MRSRGDVHVSARRLFARGCDRQEINVSMFQPCPQTNVFFLMVRVPLVCWLVVLCDRKLGSQKTNGSGLVSGIMGLFSDFIFLSVPLVTVATFPSPNCTFPQVMEGLPFLK